MSEERMMILRMLQEGKITADEAARLLDALGGQPRAAASSAAGSGPGIGDEVRKAVEDVVRAIPKESIDDARDVIRETVREGVSIARETARLAREARHWAPRGWGWHFHPGGAGGHHATAPFADVRPTSASHLIVRNTRGDLRLSRSPDGQLHVRATRRVWAPDAGEAQRLADRLPIEIHEEGSTITVEGPGARPFHERLRVDFDIAATVRASVTPRLAIVDSVRSLVILPSELWSTPTIPTSSTPRRRWRCCGSTPPAWPRR